MSFTLIPFGFETKTEQLVAVDSVPSGKACGCICPCCKTPLIARKGGVKEWHFAHLTRGTFNTTQYSCEYSFGLSVRMMARQLISGSLQLELPAWELVEKIYRDGTPEKITKTVTNKRKVLLENCQLEQRFHNCEVDVLGDVKGVPFALYFTHENREVPFELQNIAHKTKCGVIAISLNLQIKFTMAKQHGIAYTEILRQRLENDIYEKTWVYHPNYKAAARQLQQELAEMTQTAWPVTHFDRSVRAQWPEQEVKMMKRYFCERCRVEWEDWRGYFSSCPECADHLRKREIGPI